MFEFFTRAKAKPPPNKDALNDPVHIKIRGLHKSFGENKEYKVLTGVDIDIYRGKINIVIGGSGCGKSILLKLIVAIIEPDEGNISVDGFDVVGKSDFELQEVRRKFGMLFQYSALFDSMSVLDNIAFPMREHTKLSEKEIRDKVFDQLKHLKLEAAIDKFPAELSGGMRKRVGLARAMALHPKIMIFDEPTTGLDPVLTKEIDELILETVRRENVTGLMISHDMASTFRIGDYVSMLYEGKIVASGTPQEMTDSKHPIMQQYIELSGVKALAF